MLTEKVHCECIKHSFLIVESRITEVFCGYTFNFVKQAWLTSLLATFARISEAAACVREIPGIFELVRQLLHRRCQTCILRYAPPHWSYTSIIVWGVIGYHSRTPLVRIFGTLNSQRYISEVLEPVVLPYLQGLTTAIFQQDNARPHVPRIVQRLFVNHQIELLPWPARSPDLSPIENLWSMVAQ
ncbi:transposable element Tcb1 transposase [Trichonephila clavipes]|nr:transposable element Tcb1 transposase [Trichonephila clavipes]